MKESEVKNDLEEPQIEVKENENLNDEENIGLYLEENKEKNHDEETLIKYENNIKSKENNNNHDLSSPLVKDNININDKLVDDHYITILKTKLFKIPYFIFGFTTHFYFPSENLQNKMKLSEVPNPPFTLGPDGKFLLY
jgi:hypothetical protein